MQDIIVVTFKMNKDLAIAARVFASQRNQSRSELLRVALAQYMEKNSGISETGSEKYVQERMHK